MARKGKSKNKVNPIIKQVDMSSLSKEDRNLLEDISKLEHEQFSIWFSFFQKDDYRVCLRVANTPYDRLYEKDRDKYRAYASKVLKAVKRYRG
jgi:predicted DNA binding CopG/RHH family protein